MSGPFNAIEAAHQSLIAGKDGGSLSVKGVHDRVPDTSIDADFPYISGADKTIINEPRSGIVGSEITLTYHIWSRYRGSKECLQIYEQIRNLLDGKTLDIVRGRVLCDVDGGLIFTDPDGITEHMPVRVTLSHQE